MPDPDDRVAATLAGWREAEQAAASGPWKPAYRTWTEATDERCAEARIHDYDGTPVAITYLSGLLEPGDDGETEQFIVTARAAMPRLLKAVEAVLELADRYDTIPAYGPTPATRHHVARQFREAVTTALTGEEAGDEKAE